MFKSLMLAISFLTRLPYSTDEKISDNTWKNSLVFYPFCGFIIGIIAVLPLIIGVFLRNSLLIQINDIAIIALSGFLYVVISEYMNRLLHFDGFCDCLDAFSAMTASKERRLEIMKDPLVGSSGVAGGALLLFGKVIFALLICFKAIYFDSPIIYIYLLIAVPAIARLGIVFLAQIGTYPRKSGTAFNVVGKIGLMRVIIAFFSIAPLLILPLIFLDLTIWVMFFVMIFSVVYWKRKSTEALGGVTGDVLGACVETAENAMLLVILI